jgi:hypothetical protein
MDFSTCFREVKISFNVPEMFESHEYHWHHSAQSGPLGTPVTAKITDLLNINKVHINIY